ncbi:MAG: cobaltochelatase subunit CobT [Alphaproteobacteria bacterium]|nr:cobaltochelatase subunit CobT [Alphaproteobacteria bacterium]
MTQAPAPPSEQEFLRLQAEAAQALSGKAELKVSVGLNRVVDEPLAAQARILIAKSLDATDEDATRHMRGQVDLAALALKYHNHALHAQQRPLDAQAAALFDALEQVRLEALGGARYAGIRHNLAQRHQTSFAMKGYDVQNPEHTLLALPDVVAMIAREAITGDAPPEAIAALVAQMRPWVESAAKADIHSLAQTVVSQADFSRVAQEILFDLKLITHRPETREGGSEETSETGEAIGHTPDNADNDSSESEATQTLQSSGEAEPDKDGARREAKADDDFESDADQEITPQEKAPHSLPNRLELAHSTTKNYHAFTTAYDEIVAADALATRDELDHLFDSLMQKVKQYHTVTSRLATRLQRLLLAQQTRQWMYELEDGIIDNARLAQIVARPDITTIYKIENDTAFKDTVVTLLIDNSGSMRGRPITIAALSADILARTLERCGVKVEILGFTTRDWKGGQSRKAWLEAGRSANPGRLNDLRHIIYKSADQRLSRARRNLALMLKDGILKENIDGEAILWAHGRLRARHEQRKILMVISDGAPVDDSTLSANSGSTLDNHLRAVIASIEDAGDVELLAIGIGHDVTRYYSRAVTLHDVEQLGDAMLEQMTDLFAPEDIRQTRKAMRRKSA